MPRNSGPGEVLPAPPGPCWFLSLSHTSSWPAPYFAVLALPGVLPTQQLWEDHLLVEKVQASLGQRWRPGSPPRQEAWIGHAAGLCNSCLQQYCDLSGEEGWEMTELVTINCPTPHAGRGGGSGTEACPRLFLGPLGSEGVGEGWSFRRITWLCPTAGRSVCRVLCPLLVSAPHQVSHRTEPSEATAPGSPSRAGSLAARVHRTHPYDL